MSTEQTVKLIKSNTRYTDECLSAVKIVSDTSNEEIINFYGRIIGFVIKNISFTKSDFNKTSIHIC